MFWRFAFFFFFSIKVLTESLETTLLNESHSHTSKTPIDYRKPLKTRLQQSVNRLSMPKKKDPAATTNATAGSEAGGDLGNTSLTSTSNLNRASTPQPHGNASSTSNANSEIMASDIPSVTTSGISSSTSSGSSLSKKVLNS